MMLVDYAQGVFLELSVNSDLSFKPKQEQKIAVNCLLEVRDVLTVTLTGFSKSFIFQLFSMAIEQKKILEGLHPNRVPVDKPDRRPDSGRAIYWFDLCLATRSKYLSDNNPLPQLLFASAEKALNNDFKRILKDFKGSPAC